MQTPTILDGRTGESPGHAATTMEACESQTTAHSIALLVRCAAGVAMCPIRDASGVTLGRSPECDVVIEDASVSRRHALLRLAPEPTIEDLGSRNGTAVDGRRIDPGLAVPIEVGTCVELGTASVFLVRARPPAAEALDASSSPGAEIIASDPSMLRLVATLHVAAQGDAPILIQGEAGVGKKAFARLLHERSLRNGQPLRAVDCASRPERILERELFGVEAGASPETPDGAAGAFELAHGGTLVLDRIAELPMAVQAELLRVLADREVRRVGGGAPKPADVRIVVATQSDLWAMSASGAFRADLHFQLAKIPFTIPPLRERKADIVPLARHFLVLRAARRRRPPLVLTADAIEALESFDWPGNVQQLRAIVERAAAHCREPNLDAPHLRVPRKTSFGSSSAPPQRGPAKLREQVRSYERERVVDALVTAGGNQTRAAKLLGVSRATLINKLVAHGIDRPRGLMKKD
jgi:DNA-binding NtrC family response regulator